LDLLKNNKSTAKTSRSANLGTNIGKKQLQSASNLSILSRKLRNKIIWAVNRFLQHFSEQFHTIYVLYYCSIRQLGMATGKQQLKMLYGG
jgi:hypothetical protein